MATTNPALNVLLASTLIQAAVAGPTAPDNASSSKQTGSSSSPQDPVDPINGAFPGGQPTKATDVPISVVFLILFASGAFIHMATYRANSKRGHKFLLSDLVFDFCMVRIFTCIFRIAWAFTQVRAVVLLAAIFENGGAVVLFAVNLFLAQRLVRAMHPAIGWHPVFSKISLAMILSVPATIVMNIAALSISFFSVGTPHRLEATETVLKVGVSWSMALVVMPLIWVFFASAKPGEAPHNFGEGQFRTKASLLVFSATALSVGAAIRLAALTNPESPDVMSTLFSKAVFYTTGFLLEISTVAAYAFFRFDLLYHIPDGSSKPGDYAMTSSLKDPSARLWASEEIQSETSSFWMRYELPCPPGGGPLVTNPWDPSTTGQLPESRHLASRDKETVALLNDERESGVMPPATARLNQRQSLIRSFMSRCSRRQQSMMLPGEDLPISWFDGSASY